MPISALLIMLVLTWSNASGVQPDKPNIVFFLADDCTNWDIGCYGSVDSKTPNIDKLAEQGMKFTRCYQAAPMCSPTRHNIYTGIYPVKTGAYPNHTRAVDGTESIVQYLRPLGYRVALSGKRHISPEEVFPFEYLGQGQNPDFVLVEEFLAEVEEKKEPFALMLTSNEPHTPWNKGDVRLFDPSEIQLPPHYIDTKETRVAFRKYLAEINYLDGQVGKALELLKKYNFEDNTLVIFASEQGSAFPFAKWTLYEAGLKSALIARYPGVIEPGTISDVIVEYTDFLPTFIDVAGGDSPKKLDGKSLVPVFKDPENVIKEYSYGIQTTRGINFGSDHFGIRSVVNDNFRYIWNLTSQTAFLNAANNNENPSEWYSSWEEAALNCPEALTLVRKYKFRPEEELYDVKKDKWCMNNLADNPEYAEIKKKLRAELLNWMALCGDKGQETEMEAFENMPRHNEEHE